MCGLGVSSLILIDIIIDTTVIHVVPVFKGKRGNMKKFHLGNSLNLLLKNVQNHVKGNQVCNFAGAQGQQLSGIPCGLCSTLGFSDAVVCCLSFEPPTQLCEKDRRGIIQPSFCS